MRIGQLEEVAKRLNTLTDELGKSVLEIEHAINRLAMGIEVDVLTGELKLSYMRYKSRWGLYILHRDEVYAFNSAPRDIRLQAVEGLPTLLEALSGKAEVVSLQLREAVLQARSFSDAIRKVMDAQDSKRSR